MKWLVVWNSIASHPKWLALSIEERGAWVSLLCTASVQEPVRWRFRDPAHAALLLQRDGASDPEGMVARLINARWLDVTEDGGLEIHDHRDWQRYPSDMPEETAARKRRSRASLDVTRDHDRITSRGEKRAREEISATASSANRDPGTAPTETVLDALARHGLDPQMVSDFQLRRGRSGR